MTPDRVIETDNPSTLPASAAVVPVGTEAWALTRPDRHLAVLDGDGALAARCSLWWTHTPPVPGERVGLVGHYAAGTDEAATTAAAALLARATAVLAAQGSTRVLGPMDGSTWHAYRLVTDRRPDPTREEEPPFVMEPDTPAAWADHFRAAGFAPLDTYRSAVLDPIPYCDEAALAARLAAGGVTLRAFDPADASAELARIYAVSAEAFVDNPFYTPLSETAFVASYRALLPHAVFSLIRFAERDGATAGFVFALPDLLRARRGAAMDTVVVKTLAVRPPEAGQGLGGALTASVHAEARRLGFTRAVHALMHDANRSTRLGGTEARTIRRYTLFGKRL